MSTNGDAKHGFQVYDDEEGPRAIIELNAVGGIKCTQDEAVNGCEARNECGWLKLSDEAKRQTTMAHIVLLGGFDADFDRLREEVLVVLQQEHPEREDPEWLILKHLRPLRGAWNLDPNMTAPVAAWIVVQAESKANESAAPADPA